MHCFFISIWLTWSMRGKQRQIAKLCRKIFMFCLEYKCRRTVTTDTEVIFICGFLSYLFTVNACEIYCFNKLKQSKTTFVTLEHKSSHKQHRYICSNRQQYIVWVNIIDFSFMPKIIRILRSCSMKIFCKFPTVNISKLHFWLVICIAKNFIWTTLKTIFSIFRFFCTLRFQIFK